MRYLYFQPKTSLGTNKRWSSPHQQNIISLLQSCSNMQELMQIHAQMIRTRLVEDNFLVSRIIAFLASPPPHSSMDYARHVFDQIPHPNSFTWNSMMRGYTHLHAPEDALLLFKRMLRSGFPPDSRTYSVLTRACAQLNALQTGTAVHGMITKCGLEWDMFIMSGFINFYASCEKIDVAREIFDEMPDRDVVSWTSMLSGYAQLNRWDEAFLLYDQMKAVGVEPNKVTIVSLLSACGQLRALDRGRRLHSRIVENEMECDVVVGNSLVNMYAKCGVVLSAIEVFKRMPVKNTTTWNSLIGGLVQNGLYTEALTKFQEMTRSEEMPDEITVVSALLACAQLGDLQQGKRLHAYIDDHMINCDIFVRNSLLNMHAKCGDLETAEIVFLEMPERDVFSWTAMISGYVQANHCEEALTLFEEMRVSNVKANEVTLVSVLSACAQLGALDRGREVHSFIEEHKWRKFVCLENALVDMYAKCGCIEIASEIFDGMPQKDTFSWNAMIGGLATHGYGKEALDLFSQMQSIGDPKPDSVTLMAVLIACSHSGMVREGFHHLDSMYSLHGIIPGVEHYGCIVDLLCRAGLIYEAIDFIKKMPIVPSLVTWGSLLAACRVHSKMELAERIALHMIKLAPDDVGVFVLMSNLYAESGKWDDVRRMRALMASKGIEKSPGCSSIEVNGVVCEFFVGDGLLHQDLIHLMLAGLTLQSKLFS